MAEVHVLIEGYVKDNGETVQSTVTLVQDSGHNILVDPGMTHSPHAIINSLHEKSLKPEDIDTVFITHHHPDHTRYVGQFLDARVYDFAAYYAGHKWIDIDDGHEITRNVKIMRAPGHTKEDAALIVLNVTNIPEKNSCTVAICHLWWYEGKDDDPTAENIKQLKISRQKVLDTADLIVPGHGSMFAGK